MKRQPGQQAPDGEPQISDEQLRQERMEEVRRGNENRNQAALDRRNAIADAVDEIVHADLDDIDGDRIVPRTRPREEDTEAEAAREAQEAEAERARLEALGEGEPAAAHSTPPPAEEGDSKLINGVRHYLQIVNGREKWMTLEQLRQSASKVESADEYLQQAAESARRAVALRSAQGATPDEPDAETVELLNKALLGDQDSVQQLARRLSASPSRVTPDVMQAVDERLTFRDAVNWFEGEYQDELADPELKAMIVREDVRLHDANPTMGYRERLQKAGDHVRNWRNKLLGHAAGTRQSTTQTANKLQRKQQMSPPVGAGGRQASGVDDDAAESVTDQINRIAAGRHQGRAIKH